MEVNIHSINNANIAELISEEIIIANIQDGLDLLGNLYFEGFDKIIIYEKNIIPEFFDLKTGIAGEILQKFSNYRMSVAIVGDFNKYISKNLEAFISESNKLGQICFVENLREALSKLGRK